MTEVNSRKFFCFLCTRGGCRATVCLYVSRESKEAKEADSTAVLATLHTPLSPPPPAKKKHKQSMVCPRLVIATLDLLLQHGMSNVNVRKEVRIMPTSKLAREKRRTKHR